MFIRDDAKQCTGHSSCHSLCLLKILTNIYGVHTLRSKFLNPPVPLVENYFECTKKPFDAFQDAIGVASGFAGSVGSVVLLVLIPIVYIFR